MSTTAALPTNAPVPPTAPPSLTLDEFIRRYAGASVEVIKGVVKEIPTPQPRHGSVCFNAAVYLGGFIKQNGLGLVCTNDTFVLIRRARCRSAGRTWRTGARRRLPGALRRRG